MLYCKHCFLDVVQNNPVNMLTRTGAWENNICTCFPLYNACELYLFKVLLFSKTELDTAKVFWKKSSVFFALYPKWKWIWFIFSLNIIGLILMILQHCACLWKWSLKLTHKNQNHFFTFYLFFLTNSCLISRMTGSDDSACVGP